MRIRLPLLAAALLVTGCGSSGSETPTTTPPQDGSVQEDVSAEMDGTQPEAQADTKPTDVAVDKSLDADGASPPDAGPDATLEAGPEAQMEAGPDAPIEVGADVQPDIGADGPIEVGQDVQPESKPPVTYVQVVMAGDIAEDGRTQYAKTLAGMITSHSPKVDAVVLLGDNARFNPLKLMTQLTYYNTYYKPVGEANWGQFDPIAFPQLGNHEYSSLNPKGYFDYFGPRMAEIKVRPDYSGFIDDQSKGYYSFDIGGWHFVSLNSNCTSVSGGCSGGSAQGQWLKADLAAHPNQPVIAAWHAPRWACGGAHASDASLQDLWADLYDARADLLFAGHDHYYQRWKPLDKTTPEAVIDTTNGLTEVVVGSYGVSPYDVCDPAEARVSEQIGGEPAMGVFFLKLGSDGSYSFEYVLQSDGSIFDSGAGMSHHPS
jgi:hypothetical protein